MKMDLHMHTSYSNDGEFSVSELVKKVKEAKVNVFAIADHNTTLAVQEYVSNFGDQTLTLVPAIEIDCMFKQTHLHVLGYGIDPFFDGFKDLHQFYMQQDLNNSSTLIKKVEQLGIVVDHEMVYFLSTNKIITAEMIAEVVLKDKRNDDNPLLEVYRTGNSRSDNPYVNFYWDYCAINKPAYVETNYISSEDAGELIKQAGGISVVAHPGNNVFEDEELLINIINQGMKGIEVYSSYHNEKQVEFYQQLALKHNWIQTIGSDFHGKTK